jgi:hypothetical protein
MIDNVAVMDDLNDKLQELETHAANLEARVSGVERVLQKHGEKLEQIVNILAATQARPQFDPKGLLNIVKNAAILIGLTVGAIIYVTGRAYDSPLALLEYRVKLLESKK